MPTPQFPAVSDNATNEELRDAYIGISRYLTYLLSALDTLNINRLDAKVIVANTITADKMDVDELSAISANLGEVLAGVITGVLIRTAASGKRIEMTGNKIRTFNNSERLQGPAWGDVFGPNYGDLPFFDDGVGTLLIKCLGGGNGYQIGPTSGADMYLGETGLSTIGLGDWSLPLTTAIGSVTSDEISYLSGVSSPIQNQINGKAGAFSGYTGSVTVVTGVDFVAETTTTSTLNFSNGVLTSVS